MGYTPRQIDHLSMAEFMACVDGYKCANGIDDGPEPMSPDRFDALREQFKG